MSNPTTFTPSDLAKLIVTWCSDHGQAESRLLSPCPQHYIYTFDLFDFLVELDIEGVDREKIGEWFNQEQETNEKGEKGGC